MFKYRFWSFFYNDGYVCVCLRIYVDRHELLCFELVSLNDGTQWRKVISFRGLFEKKGVIFDAATEEHRFIAVLVEFAFIQGALLSTKQRIVWTLRIQEIFKEI